MRVDEMVAQGKPLFSFEFFPPKTPAGDRALFHNLAALKELGPAFVSVTCGAGGSTKGQTVELARRIHDEVGLEAVVHMTCLGVPRDDLVASVRQVKAAGLHNILALRGDGPASDEAACHADELVALVRDVYPEACVLGACYPEGHLEAASKQDDLTHLKRKVDAGVDVLVSQLFFDNRHYFEFVGRARTIGVGVPVLPGIMPIQNADQVRRFTTMCGATVPRDLQGLLDQYKVSDAATFYIGVAHAVSQSKELLASGAPGVHFYTLNKSPATRLVVEALRRELA
ncbi:MAG: methylenetetrahydrofolate reductase [NAD(P)H] [Fimbriimonadaceae bacterium]|nr:methylenetetrahydrofolate reductase [NAD(P)H] [Fimbriimonadaceae bacterium]